MSYDDEVSYPEPFGPEYVLPPGEDCPDCQCCTWRLCQRAAEQRTSCARQSDAPSTVVGCPCSAGNLWPPRAGAK